MATLIHGIAASENIDSSGEVVSIAGLDISSLTLDGQLTYEHEAAKVPDKDGKTLEMQIKIPSQVVGKILKAHKVFSEKDCQDKHQLYFWNRIKTPYLYIMGELFDDYTEAAKDIAGKFRYDADKKGQNERKVMNFSVEGSKLPGAKNGMTVTRSIARKVTLSGFPCNKAAIAEIFPHSIEKDEDDIFKTESPCEIEIFKFEYNYAEPMNKLEKSEWKHTGQGNFSHPEHGIVSVHRQSSGEYHVKHNGALAGLKGVKGSFGSIGEAGKHAGAYMSSVSNKKAFPNRSHNRPSPQMPKMEKAMEAGSAMAAPSELTQGSALGTSSSISMYSMGKPKKKKSTWLFRAEQEYQSWAKREQFEQYMKKKLPNLNKAEIKAIGQTLALQKSMKIEKALSRINPAYEEETGVHSKISKGITGHEKGVHTALKPISGTANPGESTAGRNVRLRGSGNIASANMGHQKVLGEIKAMPKPNLPKSEEMNKTTDIMMASEKKK